MLTHTSIYAHITRIYIQKHGGTHTQTNKHTQLHFTHTNILTNAPYSLFTHTHIHIILGLYPHSHTHTCIQTYMHSHTNEPAHTRAHSCNTHVFSHIQAHTHSLTPHNTCSEYIIHTMHTLAHSHTRTHTHTLYIIECTYISTPSQCTPIFLCSFYIFGLCIRKGITIPVLLHKNVLLCVFYKLRISNPGPIFKQCYRFCMASSNFHQLNCFDY